eukprot:Amastigsp_a842516_32.p3 type:complete len:137 gc:universal Amastigsp_a842516_32:113-523(+)
MGSGRSLSWAFRTTRAFDATAAVSVLRRPRPRSASFCRGSARSSTRSLASTCARPWRSLTMVTSSAPISSRRTPSCAESSGCLLRRARCRSWWVAAMISRFRMPWGSSTGSKRARKSRSRPRSVSSMWTRTSMCDR